MWLGTVRDIVQHELINNGYEGLLYCGMCCCKVGNLINCNGNKERLCCIDMCEPVEDIQKAAQKIIDKQHLQLHTTEQRNAIIAMAKNKEPIFVWL